MVMKPFTLNEEAAREWLSELVVAHELADLDDPGENRGARIGPQVHLAWQPREPGQEDAVSCLIEQAHDQKDVLSNSEHATTAIEFIDDGNDWCYRFLLHVSAPVAVTLAGPAMEVGQLGEDAVCGVDAALGILREAQQSANSLLRQLNAFVTAMTPDT
ncbi:hypothetical protein E1264_02435 [Actinomadura sp. KC216]|uniref:hypothetical protein n=1 Tax=Actinomadura sp. KC216 TaxID=2530370 RepID=UPI00104EADC7|nr:hypothetical protein [Actinomadura sp. KC216]TDB91169.1 hypothetical protein E1264_02435 [Actinomadura sp. KC216]